MASVCTCNPSQPEYFVLHKFIFDVGLMVMWLPSMVSRTSHIKRIACPQLWTTERCDAYVQESERIPLLGFLVATAALLLVYSWLYKSLTAALEWMRASGTSTRTDLTQTHREDHEDSTDHDHPLLNFHGAGPRGHIVFSYFTLFLFLHVYVSFQWMLYIYSIWLHHMIPFVALGIAQDLWIISRVLKLRRESALPPKQFSQALQTVANDGLQNRVALSSLPAAAAFSTSPSAAAGFWSHEAKPTPSQIFANTNASSTALTSKLRNEDNTTNRPRHTFVP